MLKCPLNMQLNSFLFLAECHSIFINFESILTYIDEKAKKKKIQNRV